MGKWGRLVVVVAQETEGRLLMVEGGTINDEIESRGIRLQGRGGLQTDIRIGMWRFGGKKARLILPGKSDSVHFLGFLNQVKCNEPKRDEIEIKKKRNEERC